MKFIDAITDRTDRTDMPSDFAFLLAAANYGGESFSQPAREAIDQIAEKFKTAAQFERRVVEARLKAADPAKVAASMPGVEESGQ